MVSDIYHKCGSMSAVWQEAIFIVCKVTAFEINFANFGSVAIRFSVKCLILKYPAVLFRSMAL
jgi:hypothetical protein